MCSLPETRIPFRTIVVSLLSHQVLLQNLYDILLEEFVKQPEGQDRVTPVTSDPKPAGFLRYVSMTNLAIIFDLLLDSYRTARDFDTRPGLKYLLMKVSGVCGAANLYRQSAMSFNIYFQVGWQCRWQAVARTGENVGVQTKSGLGHVTSNTVFIQ